MELELVELDPLLEPARPLESALLQGLVPILELDPMKHLAFFSVFTHFEHGKEQKHQHRHETSVTGGTAATSPVHGIGSTNGAGSISKVGSSNGVGSKVDPDQASNGVGVRVTSL